MNVRLPSARETEMPSLRQAVRPEVERLLGRDPEDDAMHHARPRTSAPRARVLEERDVRARGAALVGVEEVVDGRVVLVDGLLDQAQAEHAHVEVDVARRVAGDRSDVVDSLEAHGRLPGRFPTREPTDQIVGRRA